MAKHVSTTQVQTPAAPAAAAPSAARPRAQSPSSYQSQAAAEDVIEWGNGGPDVDDGFGGSETRAATHAVEPPEAKVTPQPGEPDYVEVSGQKTQNQPAKDPAEPEPLPGPDAEKAKETPAEKRQRALDTLAAERRSRELETKLKDAQDELGRSGKMTLGEILKAKGVNREDLLEQLLTGADGLELPAKLEGDAADLAALKTQVSDLTKQIKERDEREADRQIQDGIRVVSEQLRDVGVPLVESLGAYQDVMNEAYAAWVKGGKEGVALDHLPDAAAKVEDKLRKQHPRLAALADAAEKAKTAAPAREPAAAAPSRPGITRRTTARPEAKPAPLPEDTHERDEQIKREFGFR